LNCSSNNHMWLILADLVFHRLKQSLQYWIRRWLHEERVSGLLEERRKES